MGGTDNMVAALPFVVAMVCIISGCLLVLRFVQHRERMAMIQRGLIPARATQSARGSLQTGIVVTAVGVGLTLGLFTLGIGPWLIAGFIPLFVGLGLIALPLLARARLEQDETDEA